LGSPVEPVFSNSSQIIAVDLAKEDTGKWDGMFDISTML
jgi:hypothetical protein